MKTFFALLLIPTALLAQETSLLDRLSDEVRALTAAVDRVVVTATVRGGKTSLLQTTVYVYGHTLAGLSGRKMRKVTGVLVDNEKAVFAFTDVPRGADLTITLPDGEKAEAKYLDGDPELGIAIVSVPGAKSHVLVEGNWAKLARGSLAVTGKGLAMVNSASQPFGIVYADTDAPVLMGTRGRLMGLRSPIVAARAQNCSQCHTASHVAGNTRSRALLALGSFHEASRTAGGCPRVGHAGLPRGEGSAFVAGPVIARVLDDIARHGRIRHSYLGVVLGDSQGEGVVIGSVVADSPAAKASLRQGDRIVSVDRVRCDVAATLSRMIVVRRPGDKVTFEVQRRGTVTVTLGDRKEAQKDLVTPASVGLHCIELSDALRSYLDYGSELQGVLVRSVTPGSPAAKVGLLRGDIITKGGGGTIADMEELRAAFAGAKGRILLHGKRKGTKGHFSWGMNVGEPKQAR